MVEERSTQDRIRTLIVDELGCEDVEVTPQARFEGDLGADSLDYVEIVMRIEEEFGIEIPDEDAVKIITVKDLHEYVERAIAK